MASLQRFEHLGAWQDARRLVRAIYAKTRDLQYVEEVQFTKLSENVASVSRQLSGVHQVFVRELRKGTTRPNKLATGVFNLRVL
jgi:hypothetical protein